MFNQRQLIFLCVVAECPANPVSWCKCEAVVSMNSVAVAAKQAPPPPLVVMSLSLKITVNSKTGTNEVGVVTVSCDEWG